MHVSPRESIFHRQQRTPLNFQLNLTPNQVRKHTAQYVFALLPLFHCQP